MSSSSHRPAGGGTNDFKPAAASALPPPESSEGVRTRRKVVLSFWIVVVLLGLPVWLWTTSIHRARLPLQEMLDWADGKACKPTFPLQIVLDAPTLQEAEAQHLLRLTQHALDDMNEFSAHHLRLNLGASSSPPGTSGTVKGTPERRSAHARNNNEGPALTVRLSPGGGGVQVAKAELRPHSTILDVFYGPGQSPSTSSSSSVLANTIASSLQGLFSEEQASIAYALSSNVANGNGQHASTALGQGSQAQSSASSAAREQRTSLSRTLSPEMASKLERRATRSFRYASTYHITISLFTGGANPTGWDIDTAVREHLVPLLESFSVSNFTLDTQVQLYAAFSPSTQPELDLENKRWTLRNEDLSGFINAAEWPLGPSIGAGPTLNFILYVPDEKKSPLVVKENGGTSWLIPQWGGVVIHNPPDAASSASSSSGTAFLTEEDIRPALLTFSHQLMSLLGAPDSPASFPLQLQSMTRVRAASLLLSASSTLGSLARLTMALPSIPIPEKVALGVDKTLVNLRKTCDSLRDGRFKDALEHAKVAEAEAEHGFFEKSMVAQVYFPDEHVKM